MRFDFAASSPRTTPSVSMIPLRYISPMTSIIPEPQMPVIAVSPSDSAKPGSSLHKDEPMTFKRGSRVSRLMRTCSIAPAVAR
ncbi:unannotated protein [freshwater metagenome]|uniref:Unannotated protein n=1 Tax=freshwater metagenome TaxID=449393 RepID=A0A6J6YUN4_9ZZZZ